MKYCILIIACLFNFFVFAEDFETKYKILKGAIFESAEAWENEYNLRGQECNRVGYKEHSICYHYFWYAKGHWSQSQTLVNLIKELDDKH